MIYKMHQISKIALIVLITITIACCTNEISKQEKFVENNQHTNFSIFRDWEIEPRDENHSSGFLMKYVIPYVADTINDKISLIVYAQILSADSNRYNISITNMNKHRFCEKKCINLSRFDEYIDSVFTRFKELNISSINGKGGVYIINISSDVKILKYDTLQSDSIIMRLESLGYKRIDTDWFYKSQ
jgi:hypothetical protein